MKRALALVVLAGAVFVGRAEAAVISIVPSSLAVDVGAPVELDLVVSGLTANEAVGGVSVRLTGDGALLGAVSFALDPENKMGTEFDFESAFGPNFVDLVFVAEDFAPLNLTTLKGLQGAGFVLAHVSLLALAPGVSPITIVNQFSAYLSNADGVTTLPATTQDGLVCIGPAFAQSCQTQVPEPGLIALMAAGLAAAAAWRRQASKQS